MSILLQHHVDQIATLALFFLSELEKYSIPEDLVRLSDLALPGLAPFSQSLYSCDEDLEMIEPLPHLSPVKRPQRSGKEFLSGLQLTTADRIILLYV